RRSRGELAANERKWTQMGTQREPSADFADERRLEFRNPERVFSRRFHQSARICVICGSALPIRVHLRSFAANSLFHPSPCISPCLRGSSLPHSRAKLSRILSPAAPLFSGWNCVA